MFSNSANVLIFVEDPGAANCVAELPAILHERDITTRIVAAGLAVDCLKHRGLLIDETKYNTIDEADKLLESTKPYLLIIGTSENPDTLGLILSYQARSKGIESIGIVDAHGNADLRFRGRSDDPLTYAPDWLLVSTDYTRGAYVSLGYSKDKVIVCGHPHYDFVQKAAESFAKKDRKTIRKRLFPKISDNREVLLFASEGPVRLKPRDSQYLSECTLPRKASITGRTEMVIEEFLDALKLVSTSPYLVLRLHPKDIPEDYSEYREHFDMFNQGGSSLELIYAADFIVGMTSMFMMEAALLEKPTLSIVPRAAETVILPAINLGLTPCVTTRKQLRNVLNNFLQNKIQVNRVDNVIVFGALKRIADFIESRLR